MKEAVALLSLILLLALPAAGAEAFHLPPASSQLIVGTSKDWNDSTVTLQRWKKEGQAWEKVGPSWSGRLGTNGLAWGRGLHPGGLPGLQKVEGDKRAPAGVFELGDIYSYSTDLPRHAGLQVHKVTEKDLWVEDANSEFYNRHLELAGPPTTEWEKKQQMHQNDPAHKIKFFIKHNAEPSIEKGAGSSIFFHIWRNDGANTSYGCTVMPEDRLKELVAWVDPKQKPLYILLPQTVYAEKRTAWALP